MKPLLDSFPVAFLRVCAALLLALMALLSLAFGRTELSPWGWAWSFTAIGLAVQIAPSRIRGRIGAWAELPTLLLALLVTIRIACFGASGHASLVNIDQEGHIEGSARWVDRLFEERDASIVGSRLLVTLGVIPADEFPTLPALLVASYPSHEAFAPRLATPVVSTLLGLDHPGATNAILVSNESGGAEVGVVFLHGYAGSFAFQCLEVAAAVRDLDADVICPSDHFVGRWIGAEATSTITSSIATLRARGARRIVLVGLSNGAFGASVTARDLPIDGLVLISGVSPNAPSPRMNSLLIQGDDDSMVMTRRVRAWARSHARVHYLELPGTHFVLIEQRAQVREAIHAYVGGFSHEAH